MRFIHLFLAGYAILAVGVALGLWQAGLLQRVAPTWIAVGVIATVGVGIMMAVSAGKPVVSRDLPR